MKRRSQITTSLIGVLLIAALRVSAAATLPYDEQADPQRDLQEALASARHQQKRVLIVFGANWCEDCRALDSALHARPTAHLINAQYVVVKVDVGHFDKNLDVAHVYGDPTGKGIPSVVVVTPRNEIVYESRAGELADARHMGAGGIEAFFTDLSTKQAGY